mmetsp:Transcript_2677/g.5682  ORF Transcript_2677/g.5682 Transcript_2677/m.5682 type:complete len:254 (+) Transcript_2677:289-1050(+)
MHIRIHCQQRLDNERQLFELSSCVHLINPTQRASEVQKMRVKHHCPVEGLSIRLSLQLRFYTRSILVDTEKIPIERSTEVSHAASVALVSWPNQALSALARASHATWPSHAHSYRLSSSAASETERWPPKKLSQSRSASSATCGVGIARSDIGASLSSLVSALKSPRLVAAHQMAVPSLSEASPTPSPSAMPASDHTPSQRRCALGTSSKSPSFSSSSKSGRSHATAPATIRKSETFAEPSATIAAACLDGMR